MANNGNGTTDEGLLTLRWKVALPVFVSIILATNTGTGYIVQQKNNTAQIEYNNIRATKIANRAKEEAVKEMDFKDLTFRYEDALRELRELEKKCDK